MTDSDCLFCQIVDRRVKSQIVFESESVLGFKDVHPQAPVHLLFIPKTHVPGIDQISSSNEASVLQVVKAANQVAKEQAIATQGYRLVMNCNDNGGQTVKHLHLHLLAGRKMTWPPG